MSGSPDSYATARTLPAEQKAREADCINWPGYVMPNGYGQVSANGRHYYAHRVVWETANGRSIPVGMYVCHRCDNPPCVNPSHLFLGTPADNVRDMLNKGRQASPSKALSPEEVIELRTIRASSGLPVRALAEVFGVAPMTISRALRGIGYA